MRKQIKKANLCQDFKRNRGYVMSFVVTERGNQCLCLFVGLYDDYLPHIDVLRGEPYWLMSSDTPSARHTQLDQFHCHLAVG